MRGTQSGPEVDSTERVLHRMFALHRAVMPAVLNLEIPVESYPGKHLGHYDKFAYIGVEHPNRPDMVIESPFFCSASADFIHIQKSPHCTSRTLKLLKLFRQYCLLLEDETEADPGGDKENILAQRISLRHRILQFESIQEPVKAESATDKDYLYECIRLTCLALIHLSDTCISGRTAFDPALTVLPILVGPQKLLPRPLANPIPTALPTALGRAFRKSPSPVHGWGPHMEGLLYWVSTVGTAISRGRLEYALFSSCNSKEIWDMAFIEDGRSWDEAIIPLQTFTWFQKICLKGEIEPLMRVVVQEREQQVISTTTLRALQK